MPPRYAYWTILIDGTATAFRAREKDELLPTLHQLKRTNQDVVFKWFSRGQLWESPEEAQAALRAPKPVFEKRGASWRPGGKHVDPRERFKKKSGARSHKFDSSGPKRSDDSRPARESRPGEFRPSGPPRGDRPWGRRPPSGAPARERRPWSGKPPMRR